MLFYGTIWKNTKEDDMKKLKYNKATKEIDVKESQPVRAKKFFEKYEKVFTVPLQIFSVVVLERV